MTIYNVRTIKSPNGTGQGMNIYMAEYNHIVHTKMEYIITIGEFGWVGWGWGWGVGGGRIYVLSAF